MGSSFHKDLQLVRRIQVDDLLHVFFFNSLDRFVYIYGLYTTFTSKNGFVCRER